MEIAIDARFYGLEHAGLGRYTLNLIQELSRLDETNKYTLFVWEKYKDLNLPNNFRTAIVNAKPYSFAEQYLLPKAIGVNRFDLVHFPSFIVPIVNLNTPFIVTIHDLIKHKYGGVESSTLSPWVYGLKQMAYKFDMWWAVHKSKKIIVPTEYVKHDIAQWFRINPQKITYTYEGFDTALKIIQDPNEVTAIVNKYGIKKPYLLYVGSSYPYKQVERLIENVQNLPGDYQLVLVGSRNIFWSRISDRIKKLALNDRIHILGYVGDEELGAIYQQAFAYVTATKEEGFGITPLEAMALGCPAIISDIPVHHEVCGDAALYFDQIQASSFVSAVLSLQTDLNLRNLLVQKGYQQVGKYSWEKMAKETIEVYRQVINEGL